MIPTNTPPVQLDAMPPPPQDESQNEYVLADNVVVIGDDDSVGLQQADGVRVVSQIPNREITLEGAVPKLKPGDIILSKLGTPYMGKVTAVDTLATPSSTGYGERVKVQTGLTALEEMFEEADIRCVKTLTPEDVEEIIPLQPGVRVKSVSSSGKWDLPSITIQFEVPLEGKKSNGGGTTYATISCEVGLQPTVEFTFRLKWAWIFPYGVREFAASAAVRQWTTLGLSTSVGLEVDKEKPIATIPMAGIWAGPVYIKPGIKIYLGGKIGVEAAIETSMTYTVYAKAGAKYDGSWHNLSEFTRTFEFEPPDIKLRAYAKAWVAAKVELMIYGSLGPKVIARLFGEVVMEASVADLEISVDVYVGLELGLAFEVKIIVFKLAEFSADPLLSKKWNVWHWDWQLSGDGIPYDGGTIEFSGLSPPARGHPQTPFGSPAWAMSRRVGGVAL